MNGKMHLQFGSYVGITGGLLLATGILSSPYDSVTNGILFGIGTTIGSLFLDIDSPTSMISKKIPLIPTFINKGFGHRGFIHSPCFIGLLAVLFYCLHIDPELNIMAIGFLLGCVLHLIQDILTKGGIPILYPFCREKFSLGFLKSGSKADPIITIILEIIWTFFICYLVYICCFKK